ncbi:MAG: SPW repeat protein [Gallionella sp.]
MNVLLGTWVVVSPWAMEYSLNGAATANACGLGAVLVIFNLMSVCRLVDQGQEIFNILLGVWLILSPFSLDFAATREPAINAFAIGAMIVVLAGWQIYDAPKSSK